MLFINTTITVEAQYNYLPILILLEVITCTLLIAYSCYTQHVKTVSMLFLVFNLALFQSLLSFLVLLDNYSYKTTQFSGFNSFQLGLLSLTGGGLFDELTFGLDTVALIFILLTIFLITQALFLGANTRKFGSLRFFNATLILIQTFLIIAFYTTNLFIFYIGFEGLTLPTFFLIFIFGADKLKFRAAKLFLIYSFLSSTFLSFGITLLYVQLQTTSLNRIITLLTIKEGTNSLIISTERYIFIFILLFIAFGIKIPIAPFHM